MKVGFRICIWKFTLTVNTNVRYAKRNGRNKRR